ncbi:hypothetical protein Nmel_001232 [Mimus melanotis]
MMGQGMSAQERDVFELITKLLGQHGKSLPSDDLKIILKWTAVKLPRVTTSTIFTTDLWDKVGIKLWHCAMKGDKVAAEMLPSWQVIFEVLKAQEKSHAKDKGDTSCPPSITEPQSSLQSEETTSLLAQPKAPPLMRDPSRSVEAFVSGCCREDSEDDGEEDLFDPRPIYHEKEPNLYPP